jgi:hypothetical protein
MFSQYFGNDDNKDSIGLAKQLVLGTGLFSGLYNKEEVVVSTTSPTGGVNAATTSNVARHRSKSTVLVLKPELHCLGVDKHITVGGASGITMSLQSTASLKTNKEGAATLQSRTMYLRAQEPLRNCKKALSIVSRYNSSYTSYSSMGILPSGMVMEDYYMFERKNIYSLLVKSKTTSAEESSMSLIDTHNDSDMPETWLFSNFLSLC